MPLALVSFKSNIRALDAPANRHSAERKLE